MIIFNSLSIFCQYKRKYQSGKKVKLKSITLISTFFLKLEILHSTVVTTFYVMNKWWKVNVAKIGEATFLHYYANIFGYFFGN